jgi:hypothetical protein
MGRISLDGTVELVVGLNNNAGENIVELRVQLTPRASRHAALASGPIMIPLQHIRDLIKRLEGVLEISGFKDQEY